jgi:hypothetical protein
MNTASEVLLLIVSSVLSIFLLIAIVAGVKVIQLLRTLGRIAEQAEKLADSAEAVGELFRKTAGPLAFGKFLTSVVESAVKHKKHKEE